MSNWNAKQQQQQQQEKKTHVRRQIEQLVVLSGMVEIWLTIWRDVSETLLNGEDVATPTQPASQPAASQSVSHIATLLSPFYGQPVFADTPLEDFTGANFHYLHTLADVKSISCI